MNIFYVCYGLSIEACYQIIISSFDKRVPKAESAERTDEKGWAG